MEHANFFSLFFLTFMATAMAMSMAADPQSSTTTTSTTTQAYNNFVKTSCNATTYPSVCLTSLLPYANSVKSNPVRLVKQALTATVKSASATRSVVSKLAKSKNISKGDAAILKDCIEELKDSIDEITDSLKAISSLGSSSSVNKRFAISNAQTWTSAAITDVYTCIDEFSDQKVSPAVKKKIRSSIVSIARRSSNALYLINHLNI
ncbi:pectinesterase inhibitor 11 [Lactuca sativa]|uniref:pectinesterase inhibitor 11 n=1 Tax=Lactuca sativa TaxID=4236 RepID=UPI000CC1EA2A|nr:pectinesterase inhibitor 11 [Lactuca sativa]